eukprot:SAG31_NODE_5226_length_2662_cov_1.657956_1_plen_140_part_00
MISQVIEFRICVDGVRPRVPDLHKLAEFYSSAEAQLKAYVDLMRECWERNPRRRPTFHASAELPVYYTPDIISGRGTAIAQTITELPSISASEEMESATLAENSAGALLISERLQQLRVFFKVEKLSNRHSHEPEAEAK